jgi:hypothetical protein
MSINNISIRAVSDTFNQTGGSMKYKRKKPFVDCPNLRELLKKRQPQPPPSPSFEGVDLGPHHPLESEESGNKWLKDIREFDNIVDDAMHLPRRD